MFESVLKYNDFACGVIFLLFAILQFTYKNRKFINYNLAGLYFCLSYVILTFWAFRTGTISYFPVLLFTDMTTAFAIGPFVYFYIRSILGFTLESHKKYFIHFIPAAVILCAIIINNFIDHPKIQSHFNSLTDYPVNEMNPLIRIIDFVSNIYIILYFVPSVKNIYVVLKNKNHKSMRELNTVFYYLLLAIACFLMMLLSNIMHLSVLNFISIYLLVIMGVWYSLYSFRHPEFTQKAIKEAKVLRYQNSMNTGIKTDLVLSRLDDLMEEEKIFLDDELTLQKLSSMLMITQHQLSMILNSKRKVNFRSLVNSYRIRESMKQMEEFPDKTVLDIALESGFNSKSSFNAVFIKLTGTTPTDYRRSLIH